MMGKIFMVFLSIIIPAYNSKKTIAPLIFSIAAAAKVDFGEIEIVIVDDGSTDGTVEKIEKDDKLLRSLNKLKSIKIIKLKKNSGPAAARNIGVKYASGKIVLFLDADVVLYKNTLFEVIRSFKNDLDLYALTGVWDKRQKSDKFFPKFKALRDWSYWINERNPRDYYYLFSTRIAAIDRGLFLRLGGFNTTYKAALVEDIELTYRIAKRYAVVFNPKVKVAHEFEGFLPIAKKYFWRSYYWSRIYRERKKFDPVATTSKEAITTISAGLLVLFSFLYFIMIILNYKTGVIVGGVYLSLKSIIFTFLSLILFIHLRGVRKFLWFCLKEEGLLFAIKAFFTGIALYLVILSGAGASLFTVSSQARQGK